MRSRLIRLGAAQVLNAGTIGGNIANGSPIGDMPPALIALDAGLLVSRATGVREMPLVCPIGLPGIDGKEPATIALSLAAQLMKGKPWIRVNNDVRSGNGHQ